MTKNSNVSTFAVLDFLFSGLALVGILCICAVLVYGIFFSGDPRGEIAAGVFGCFVLLLPLSVGFIVFLIAGIGLLKRKTWGYYLHIVASVLAVFSCIGIVYTVFALVFAFRPEFKSEFFGPPSE